MDYAGDEEPVVLVDKHPFPLFIDEAEVWALVPIRLTSTLCSLTDEKHHEIVCNNSSIRLCLVIRYLLRPRLNLLHIQRTSLLMQSSPVQGWLVYSYSVRQQAF